ncbi:hypothetical protein PBCVNY2B_152R [Paramecium bursaria Chlorella virus NY2B]|uniref:Uncharacterized protein B133R n=1 Tax=Paramecium bursaria Chlorella virus NY2A TaxID=46021 RepID=A7IW08_PBCVN|nr:hypothetical protein NY2A_B133R [Paramecium bursaria Chlorella virus NY2A]ABT14532.1 hypothetical protein NY2A_B133R [Paramecium bursaria Chlorella virus NY2A]AGE54117.1 hypothetical protein PBCVIL52s1_145L [Paramecium bursaria Chlorella virus IL-5-2s1]AGE58240.1 hypothetical protein PBCVNY2B_152R [Paramecium bursaria Chlorella virus NY2B]
MFVPVPDKVSERGLTYEISKEHWTIVSISKKGKRRVLKPHNDQVCIDGKIYKVYEIAKLAGLEPKPWPEDDREYEELKTISDIRGYRYRTFRNAQVQKMDQYGIVSYQEHTKHSNGYYKVAIARESISVHQMMGETRFVPKPPNMPSDWTVHHIDNDPSNNHCDNLVWASPKKQRDEQRPREQHRNDSCPVIAIALRDISLKDGTLLHKGEDKLFDNAYKAVESIISGNRGHISSCLNGRLTSHANFTWRTPLSDIDFDGEVFKSIGKNKDYERLISIFGRMKHVFTNGYTKIQYAKDIRTTREQRERDMYPIIWIDRNNVLFHRVVVELFFGPIPKTIVIDGNTHRLVVDHIDDNKQNARLVNLQILTSQENSKKRHLKSYITSVASIYNKEYEYHKTRNDAVEYVKNQGYPEATLDELNTYVNTPNKVYGRTWIRAHFETTE